MTGAKVAHNGRVTTAAPAPSPGRFEFSVSSLNLFAELLAGVNLNVGAAGDNLEDQARVLSAARRELLLALDQIEAAAP